MKQHLIRTAVATGLASWLTLVGLPLHAGPAASTTRLAHCNWGDFCCNNPPPALKPQVVAKPTQAKLACDPDLSTPGECWTNCKTEEDITICDIIKLDTFMPEAPRPGQLSAGSDRQPFLGRMITKIGTGGRKARGHVVN